jgi:hypothetical protein
MFTNDNNGGFFQPGQSAGAGAYGGFGNQDGGFGGSFMDGGQN